MKKVLIFALIVAFLSVVAFADDPSNNRGTVTLSMGIGTAVQLEIGAPSESIEGISGAGSWLWGNPDSEDIPAQVITAAVTIKANTKFKLTGAFNETSPYNGAVIVENAAGDKGIKVKAQFNGPLGLIDAVDWGVFTYAELVANGGMSTGMATGELQFSLESFAPDGETFSWFDVEAGTQTPVQYIATISPEA